MKTQIPCPYSNCSRVYLGRKNLERHINIAHTDPDKFRCKVCNKLLSSKQNFKEHMYIHTGVKPYTCEDCGAVFRQGSQLCAHKRIHRALRQTLASVPQNPVANLGAKMAESSSTTDNLQVTKCETKVKPVIELTVAQIDSGSPFELPRLEGELPSIFGATSLVGDT